MSWTPACGQWQSGRTGPCRGLETAMDGLEEQIRQGTLDRPGKRRLGKRVLILAAALAVLACGFAVAAERMGWLSPVVDDGGSGGMLKTCSVQVDQTVEGNHCDLTLENAITDGRVIYCLVTARYDESFPDIDDVMEDTLLFAGSWADVSAAGGWTKARNSTRPGLFWPPGRCRRTLRRIVKRTTWDGRWSWW